ncbi:Uridylate kinase [Dirofilaria immitis]
MAISIRIVAFIIIFPLSKSLETLPWSSESQKLPLFNDEYEEKSNMRQSLLEKLNEFSRKNLQKLVMFKPNNVHQEYLPTAGEKYQEGLIPENQYHISKIQPNYRTTPIISEVDKTESSLKIPRQSDISDEWKKIRERRLRFYKAFRKIQNLHHKRFSAEDSAMNTNRIVGDIDNINYRQRKNRESSIDPINVTFSDWETFITDYSQVIPQYKRRKAMLTEYKATDTNNMSNQLLKKSTINSPSEYITSIRKMHSSGITRNPLDYQQLVTNLNSAHEMVSNEAETTEHLPPPPNPRSTEASVHSVKVYPPSQEPFSVDYQRKSIYQNNNPSSGNYQKYSSGYGERAGIEQPISQLMSNNYNVAETYMPEANLDCITDPCETDNVYPLDPTENERCNSPRLKQIILQNIVERDIESSKQAIYNVCEAEMEIPCNVICGTSFYSYIARASQFCLVSAMDISCYAFIPACDFDSDITVKRHRVRV